MNQDLIDNFRLLQTYYRSKNDRGRVIAYGKAITVLRTLNFKIANVSQVQGIRGIGPKITAKIKEYLDTGRIRAAEEKKKEIKKVVKLSRDQKTINEFTTIWGIGPAKAKQLYSSGIHSIAELKRQPNLLTDQQKIGLKYHKDLLKKIPRENITVLATLITYFLNKKYGRDTFRLKIAGSYRRGAKESGDVDCLVSSKKFGLQEMVRLLREKKVITDVLSMRRTKFMGIAHCPGHDGQHVRLDIEFMPEESWGTALLYFTGSKGFNIYMRGIAKKKGYTLNEYGIFRASGEKVIESPTEQDVFEILGMEYVPPERR